MVLVLLHASPCLVHSSNRPYHVASLAHSLRVNLCGCDRYGNGFFQQLSRSPVGVANADRFYFAGFVVVAALSLWNGLALLEMALRLVP